MGSGSRLGSAASALAPLGLLVGSRSSPMRMAMGSAEHARLGGRSRLGTNSRVGAWTWLGTCPGLGSAASAQAPLGLLAGSSRSSPMRMAVILGALHAIQRSRAAVPFTSAVQASTQSMDGTVRHTNQWLLAAMLAALLIGATWYCVSVWRAAPSMPPYGNIILGAAATLVLVSGCDLIALIFYARRRGYDDPACSNRTRQQ